MSRLRWALLMSTTIATSAMPQEASYNLYGGPGLIDMPSAELPDDGQLAVTYGIFESNQRTSVNFQILPRINGTVRHSSVSDFDVGGGTRADRSFDLQFQLLLEDKNGWRPGVAMGLRDFLGDGPHGAEYLVASKSVTDDIKVTAGIGWGRLGTQGSFGSLGDRDPVTVPAGRLQTGSYFQGDAAVFAGIEWNTPIKNVTFKAEYSSDDYAGESAITGFNHRSPFNFGLTWAPNKSLSLSGYYLYGDTVGFQLNLTGNPKRPIAPQDLGSGPVPIRARAADAPRSAAWAGKSENRDLLIKAIGDALAADGILIEEAKLSGTQADLYISSTRTGRLPKAIGRTARILALAMPPSIEIFRITPVEKGLSTTTVEIKRSDLEAQADTPDAGLTSWQAATLTDAVGRLDRDVSYVRPIDRFSWSLNPSIPFSLFDPDETVKPDLNFSARANYQISRGFSVTGEVSKLMIGSSEENVSTSTSPLPHVRSDSNLYYSGRGIKLERLTADLVFKPTPQIYTRLSAGMLERMFAGVSAEVLWAPTASNFALGAEVNYARQREAHEPLGLGDYDVITGHGSIYWDTGFYGLEAQLDAGRYLAGDWGATATLSRRFSNGWDVSAYVTRTDVSFDDFGEGSYAKGVRITMPLRWGLPMETRSTASLQMEDLSRDGGARLRVNGRLYERIREADSNSLEGQWATYWQ